MMHEKRFIGLCALLLAFAATDVGAQPPAGGQLDRDLRTSGVNSRINNGVATISGTVRSQAERDRAAMIARRTPGVRHVENRIIVIPEPSSGVGRAESSAGRADLPSTPRTATRLPIGAETLVRRKLEADPRFADRGIEVRANSRNAITLRGEVGTEAEKAIAGRLAAEAAPGTEVRNHLVVR